jgi:hypothetical protein
MEVMATNRTTTMILSSLRSRENELPDPFFARMRIFAFQGIGQVDSPVPISQVVLVQLLCRGQLDAQRLDQAIGQDSHSVLSPLGISDQNLALAEVQFLDP